MKQKQIACSIGALIENSIPNYFLERGNKPFALILHSAHVQEFCREMDRLSHLLDGIVVLSNPAFMTSVLMDDYANAIEL
ncbi:hypothetical protein [uncultured Caballeronia sp.]|jgi:hypothetical protein|uniref:hypothetical protein n=1 Tax=uncultured Caballeronia sp. TaxID=1827198 RepID=UPI0035C9A799